MTAPATHAPADAAPAPTPADELLQVQKELLAAVREQNELLKKPQKVAWPNAILVAGWFISLAGIVLVGGYVLFYIVPAVFSWLTTGRVK